MPVPTIAPWQIVLATYCMAYANISTWPIDGCAMAPYQFDQSVVATVCTNVLHKYLYAQLFDLKLTLSCFTLAIYMMFHWFFPSVWCLDHPIDCSNAASYCEWLFSKWSSITTWRVNSCSSIILLFLEDILTKFVDDAQKWWSFVNVFGHVLLECCWCWSGSCSASHVQHLSFTKLLFGVSMSISFLTDRHSHWDFEQAPC